MTAEDRKELAQLYKQYRAAHVFVQAVSSLSGEASAPIAGLKIPKCQLSDMATLVHMTEYRHIRSIQQYGLLPGGGNTAGNKQRNMNHFLPIDIRNNCCLSTKLWDVPDSTPAMSVPDEPYLRFYSQLYCEVLRLVGKGHDKFKIETRRLAFKNIKIREVEAWRNEAEEKLDRHQLHGVSKLHTETWLNFLSLDDDWKDEVTNICVVSRNAHCRKRLRKREMT